MGNAHTNLSPVAQHNQQANMGCVQSLGGDTELLAAVSGRKFVGQDPTSFGEDMSLTLTVTGSKVTVEGRGDMYRRADPNAKDTEAEWTDHVSFPCMQQKDKMLTFKFSEKRWIFKDKLGTRWTILDENRIQMLQCISGLISRGDETYTMPRGKVLEAPPRVADAA